MIHSQFRWHDRRCSLDHQGLLRQSRSSQRPPAGQALFMMHYRLRSFTLLTSRSQQAPRCPRFWPVWTFQSYKYSLVKFRSVEDDYNEIRILLRLCERFGRDLFAALEIWACVLEISPRLRLIVDIVCCHFRHLWTCSLCVSQTLLFFVVADASVKVDRHFNHKIVVLFVLAIIWFTATVSLATFRHKSWFFVLYCFSFIRYSTFWYTFMMHGV